MIGAFFDPAGITARESMLPEAARAAGLQLERANGMHEAIWGVAYLVGPGVGGLLIAVVGATNAFWATAALFAVSAGLMFVVGVPGAGRPAMHGRLLEFWPATKEGLVFLWREPVLRSVAVMTALVVGFWLPIEGVLLPVYFEARQQPGHLGAVLMAISAGAVIGALAYAAVGARFPRRRALNASLLGAALAVLGMAFLPPLPGAPRLRVRCRRYVRADQPDRQRGAAGADAGSPPGEGAGALDLDRLRGRSRRVPPRRTVDRARSASAGRSCFSRAVSSSLRWPRLPSGASRASTTPLDSDVGRLDP